MFPGSVDFNLAEQSHLGLEIVARTDIADPVEDL